MKKIVAATVLLFISVCIQAQPARPPFIEERLKRTDEMIRQEVQPTSAQQNSIMATFKTFFLAEEKLRKDNPPPPPDAKVKAAMDKLLKERDDSIKKILTADQYKKYLLVEKKLHPPKPGDMQKTGTPPPRL